jgi:hypothetical protein
MTGVSKTVRDLRSIATWCRSNDWPSMAASSQASDGLRIVVGCCCSGWQWFFEFENFAMAEGCEVLECCRGGLCCSTCLISLAMRPKLLLKFLEEISDTALNKNLIPHMALQNFI